MDSLAGEAGRSISFPVVCSPLRPVDSEKAGGRDANKGVGRCPAGEEVGEKLA